MLLRTISKSCKRRQQSFYKINMGMGNRFNGLIQRIWIPKREGGAADASLQWFTGRASGCSCKFFRSS